MQRKSNNYFDEESKALYSSGSESDVSQEDEGRHSPSWGQAARPSHLSDNSARSADEQSDEEVSGGEGDSLEGVSNDKESSAEEEDSSLEEDEEYNRYPPSNNGIHTVREDSQENSDESIDGIEQRIKKLEKDL